MMHAHQYLDTFLHLMQHPDLHFRTRKSRHENEAPRLDKRCATLKAVIVKNFEDIITKIDKDVNHQKYKIY